MAEPGDEDTTSIDLDLIAEELGKVAKLAGRLNQAELATEIGALVAKTRAKASSHEQADNPDS